MALVVTEMQIQIATILCVFLSEKLSLTMPSIEEHVDPRFIYTWRECKRMTPGGFYLLKVSIHTPWTHSPTPGLRVS